MARLRGHRGETHTSANSSWVGLDGADNTTVEQSGTTADCFGGSPAYFAWYELYPTAPIEYSAAVAPADNMSAPVTYTGSGAGICWRGPGELVLNECGDVGVAEFVEGHGVEGGDEVVVDVVVVAGVGGWFELEMLGLQPVGEVFSEGLVGVGVEPGGRALKQSAQDGAGVLLDATPGATASGIAAAATGRIRCVAVDDGPSMLIRPDACVAWADENGSADGLDEALRRWFNPAN